MRQGQGQVERVEAVIMTGTREECISVTGTRGEGNDMP